MNTEEIHVANPLLKYPRNESCWCESGVKAKKCCLPKQTLTVPKEFANQAKQHVLTVRNQRKNA